MEESTFSGVASVCSKGICKFAAMAMNIFQRNKWRSRLVWFGLALLLILGLGTPAFTQTGNQSDVTGPNPLERVRNRSADPQSTPSNARRQFEMNLRSASFDQAIQLIEEFQAAEFSQYLGVDLYGQTLSADQISDALADLAQRVGTRAAVLNIVSLEDSLEIFPIFPSPLTSRTQVPTIAAAKANQPDDPAVATLRLRESIPQAKRQLLQPVINDFRINTTDPELDNNQRHRLSARQLYSWIIEPIEDRLKDNQIDTLVFAMDGGLRSMPIAALYDGQQFLIEKYRIALIPTFSLTDIRYSDVRTSRVLAMGASQFVNQNPLYGVPIELTKILTSPWQGQEFLNEQFTLAQFRAIARQEAFRVIHLATHAEFRPGQFDNSYVQFWDQQLSLKQLPKLSQELGWNAANTKPVEMLVLSACRTAIGDEQAELGFAGLSVAAGVKSSLGSLWYVSDVGTLALMLAFYNNLGKTPLKSEALRQAQISLLQGKVRFENNQVVLDNGTRIDLPPELHFGNQILSTHPYYWAGFTLIGNWN